MWLQLNFIWDVTQRWLVVISLYVCDHDVEIFAVRYTSHLQSYLHLCSMLCSRQFTVTARCTGDDEDDGACVCYPDQITPEGCEHSEHGLNSVRPINLRRQLCPLYRNPSGCRVVVFSLVISVEPPLIRVLSWKPIKAKSVILGAEIE